MSAEKVAPAGTVPSLLFEGATVAPHLPGEPQLRRASTPVRAARLALRTLASLLLAALTSWLWPFYLLLVAIYGWAPNVPRLRQALRYLRLTWTVAPPPPGMSVLDRAWLTASILRVCSTTPVLGLAWLLDEVYCGAALRKTPIVAPLFEISAARSGSTQLARYLEGDPHLIAPPFIHCLFPYLWLWRIVPPTIGRFVAPDRVRAMMESMTAPEFQQRHEADPFLTDTFDLALLGRHLNHLSLALGPEVMAEDFAFGALASHNRELWEGDFIRLLDGVARKTLLYAGPGADGKPRRLFIKGHFLCAADALEKKYPDARFLTMIREPAPRLQSAVNFLRSNPFETSLGNPPHWSWLGAALAISETAYCEVEQTWFSREEGPRRCVLRFSEYKRDLPGTLARVYRECLDTPTLPSYAPRTHAKRDRKNYSLDRSLAAVGIDEDALNDRLASYISWCREREE